MNKTMVFLSVCCLVFTSCATAGNRALKNETTETMSTKIVEGKTTKQEIRSMFGQPFQVSFTDSGLEIYHYELTELQSNVINFIPVVNLLDSEYDGTKKTLTVLFDRSDVVVRYSLEASTVNVRRGLFQ